MGRCGGGGEPGNQFTSRAILVKAIPGTDRDNLRRRFRHTESNARTRRVGQIVLAATVVIMVVACVALGYLAVFLG